MKLERLFYAKNAKLYKIDGNEVSLEGKSFPIKWSEIEPVEEEYNEDFLAKLRNKLKEFEEKEKFVFIEPLFDKEGNFTQFTAAMKHTARRIKDCISVIGFAIPNEIFENRAFYMGELSAKHAHYCFFCKKVADDNVVLY